ncbi:oligosaccharide flippase family protein [Noviherbaspirillum sp. Root189]|uniref:oligosaccharide flippase family protein n=1 Tax=Noviherbaspirillum sp. Root189 TaxID=1736487 RepID=UPI001F48B2E5|nr:oligosaccharide flippase family protein [Noviherbaspirillum sp. Root189]
MAISFRNNVAANYASQLYVTLIGIAVLPQYVAYMGAEAFGLVGFFTMLQMWFQLLDMGMTPTLARETARFRGGAIDANSLRRLLRSLEGIFCAIGLVGAGILIINSHTVAGSWLNVQKLPLEEVDHALMLMALIVALRWISGLYRGAIGAFERQVWLGGFNVVIASIRFILVIPFFVYVGTSPTEFFLFQFGVAIVELGVLVIKTYRLLPPLSGKAGITWEWAPVRTVLGFAVSVALTNWVWVLLTQTDKLVLSKYLPLTDYGYFTLGVLVASAVTLVAGPISVALVPRLTRLVAAGNDSGVVDLYRNATQMVAVIAVPAALVLALFSEQVLWVWTGNAELSRQAAPVLRLYAIGNCVLAIGSFPYYLQVAKGDLKLHLLGSLVFLLLLIPGLLWATLRYGATGAGYAWIAANTLYFFMWVPLVHRRFLRGLHLDWMTRDVGAIAVTGLAGAAALQWWISWPHSRMSVAAIIIVSGLFLLALTAAGSSWARDLVGLKKHSQLAG